MTTATTTTAPGTSGTKKPNYSRKTLKKMGRDKRKKKLLADKEFAKTYFSAKSKRANDKKSVFRKKKSKKK